MRTDTGRSVACFLLACLGLTSVPMSAAAAAEEGALLELYINVGDSLNLTEIRLKRVH